MGRRRRIPLPKEFGGGAGIVGGWKIFLILIAGGVGGGGGGGGGIFQNFKLKVMKNAYF